MYDLFIKPFDYVAYIKIGTVYINDIPRILELIKQYIESAPIDNIYKITLKEKYKDSKFMKVSIRDCYENDKEIYSTIYDIDNDIFLKEEWSMDMHTLGYIVGVTALVYGMYQKIKFDCLQLASKKVAEAEGHTELDGKERLQLATDMIKSELPFVFTHSLLRNVAIKFIDYSYKNSKEFAEGYAKIKTGESIEDIVEKLADVEKLEPEDTESDEFME